MLARLLKAVKPRLGQGALRWVLQRLGVIPLGRVIYNRHLLRRGVHQARIFDQPLRFAVSNAGEITRIDSLTREGPFIEKILAYHHRLFPK